MGTLDADAWEEEAARKPPAAPEPVVPSAPQAPDEKSDPTPGGADTVAPEPQHTLVDDGSAGGGTTAELIDELNKKRTGSGTDSDQVEPNEKTANPTMTINMDREAPWGGSDPTVNRRKFEGDDGQDYQLLRIVGEGAMGVVYEARQRGIGRKVAVKKIKPDKPRAGDSAEKTSEKRKKRRGRFLSEARITGELDHPNIVPIHELGEGDDGQLFYSMKLVSGTPWEHAVADKTRSENLEIWFKVADAVAFAHSRDVIHRDLKPENVMLGQYGEVLLVDWGTAIDLSQDKKVGLAGSPAYMAPEMAERLPTRIDHRSDVYLLGSVLFELITGKPPHPGRDAREALHAARQNEFAPHDPQDELTRIALQAMATDQDERYRSVAVLQDAVREYLAHNESMALAARADEQLSQAEEQQDYETFARTLHAFEDALEMWPESTKAIDGIDRTRLAYAQCTLDQGAYDLGLKVLERHKDGAKFQALYQELSKKHKASRARDKQLRFARRMIAWCVLIALLIVATLAVMADQQRRQAIANRKVAVYEKGEAVKARKKAVEQKGKADAAALRAKQQEGIAKNEEKKAIAAAKESERAKNIAKNEEKKAIAAAMESDRQKNIAKMEEKKATAAAAEATRQTKIAQREKKRTDVLQYRSLVSLAESRGLEGQIGAALRTLKTIRQQAKEKSTRINWAWHRVHRSSFGHIPHVLVPAGAGTAGAVAVSANGQIAVAALQDGNKQSGRSQVHVFDKQRLAGQFPPPGVRLATVVSLDISADGQWIVFITVDKKAHLWRWKLTKHRLLSQVDSASAARFSNAGQSLWVVGQQKGQRIGRPSAWHFQMQNGDWKFSQVKPGVARGSVRSLHAVSDKLVSYITPGGKRSPALYYHDFGANRTSRIPEASQADQGPSRIPKTATALQPMVLIPTKKFAVFAFERGDFKVWDLGTHKGHLVSDRRGHNETIHWMDVSADGKRLVTAGGDKRLLVWKLSWRKAADGTEEFVSASIESEQPIGQISALAVSDDGSQLVTAGSRAIYFWNLRGGSQDRQRLQAGNLKVVAAALSPDGRTVMIDRRGDLHLVAANAKPFSRPIAHRTAAAKVGRMLYLQSRKRIVTVGGDGTAVVWDAPTGQIEKQFTGIGLTGAGAIAGDRVLFTGTDDAKHSLHAWDLHTLNEITPVAVNSHLNRHNDVVKNELRDIDVQGKHLVLRTIENVTAICDVSNPASPQLRLVRPPTMDSQRLSVFPGLVTSNDQSLVFRLFGAGDKAFVDTMSTTGSSDVKRLNLTSKPRRLQTPSTGNSQHLLVDVFDPTTFAQVYKPTNSNMQLVGQLAGSPNLLASHFLNPTTVIVLVGKMGEKLELRQWKVGGKSTLAGLSRYSHPAAKNLPLRSKQFRPNQLTVHSDGIGLFDGQNGYWITVQQANPVGLVTECVAATIDEKVETVATLHRDGQVWVRRSPWKTSRPVRLPGLYSHAEISADGKQLAVISKHVTTGNVGQLIVWKRAQWESLRGPNAQVPTTVVAKAVRTSCWLKSGELLAVDGQGKCAVISNQQSKPTGQQLASAQSIKTIQAAPQAAYQVALYESGELDLWIPKDGTPASWTSHRIRTGVSCYAMTQIQGSNVLVTGDKLGNVFVSHISTDVASDMPGESAVVIGELFTLDGGHERREITSLTFSADGKTLVSTDDQGRAVLWFSSGWNEAAE